MLLKSHLLLIPMFTNSFWLSYPHGDFLNIFYLFPNSNPSPYSFKLFSPLGSPDHNLIPLSWAFAPVPSQGSPQSRWFCHFASTEWDDLRLYCSNFPWNDYCFSVKDPFLSAKRIAERCIFHTLSLTIKQYSLVHLSLFLCHP